MMVLLQCYMYLSEYYNYHLDLVYRQVAGGVCGYFIICSFIHHREDTIKAGRKTLKHKCCARLTVNTENVNV